MFLTKTGNTINCQTSKCATTQYNNRLGSQVMGQLHSKISALRDPGKRYAVSFTISKVANFDNIYSAGLYMIQTFVYFNI